MVGPVVPSLGAARRRPERQAELRPLSSKESAEAGRTTLGLAPGYFNTDPMEDIIGLNSQGQIWLTYDRGANWVQIPGTLAKLYTIWLN